MSTIVNYGKNITKLKFRKSALPRTEALTFETLRSSSNFPMFWLIGVKWNYFAFLGTLRCAQKQRNEKRFTFVRNIYIKTACINVFDQLSQNLSRSKGVPNTDLIQEHSSRFLQTNTTNSWDFSIQRYNFQIQHTLWNKTVQRGHIDEAITRSNRQHKYVKDFYLNNSLKLYADVYATLAKKAEIAGHSNEPAKPDSVSSRSIIERRKIKTATNNH